MQDENATAEGTALWEDGPVVLLGFGAFLGIVTAMFGPPNLQGLAMMGSLAFAGLAGLARLPPVRRWRAARRGRGAVPPM